MTRRLSRQKLAEAQKDLWLAEIAREEEDALLVTLAGDGRVLALEPRGLHALAVAQESLDPWVMPGELRISRPFELVDVVDFEPEDEIAARFHEVDGEQLADILSASRIDWALGDAESLAAAPLVLDLRVENWSEEPRCDLHLLLGVNSLLVVDEQEVDLEPGEDEAQKADSGSATPHEAPQEPPFELEPHDVSEDLVAPLRTFFEAQHRDDWASLSSVWPSLDLGPDQQLIHLARHFHSLEDWGYARMIESCKSEGDLAALRLRGILHSAPEDGLEALNEECQWTFSLRRRAEGYIIRGWSRGWPSVGGAEAIPDASKPWLDRWAGGEITRD